MTLIFSNENRIRFDIKTTDQLLRLYFGKRFASLFYSKNFFEEQTFCKAKHFAPLDSHAFLLKKNKLFSTLTNPFAFAPLFPCPYLLRGGASKFLCFSCRAPSCPCPYPGRGNTDPVCRAPSRPVRGSVKGQVGAQGRDGARQSKIGTGLLCKQSNLEAPPLSKEGHKARQLPLASTGCTSPAPRGSRALAPSPIPVRGVMGHANLRLSKGQEKASRGVHGNGTARYGKGVPLRGKTKTRKVVRPYLAVRLFDWQGPAAPPFFTLNCRESKQFNIKRAGTSRFCLQGKSSQNNIKQTSADNVSEKLTLPVFGALTTHVLAPVNPLALCPIGAQGVPLRGKTIAPGPCQSSIGTGKKVSLKRNLPLKGLGLGSARERHGVVIALKAGKRFRPLCKKGTKQINFQVRPYPGRGNTDPLCCAPSCPCQSSIGKGAHTESVRQVGAQERAGFAKAKLTLTSKEVSFTSVKPKGVRVRKTSQKKKIIFNFIPRSFYFVKAILVYALQRSKAAANRAFAYKIKLSHTIKIKIWSLAFGGSFLIVSITSILQQEQDRWFFPFFRRQMPGLYQISQGGSLESFENIITKYINRQNFAYKSCYKGVDLRFSKSLPISKPESFAKANFSFEEITNRHIPATDSFSTKLGSKSFDSKTTPWPFLTSPTPKWQLPVLLSRWKVVSDALARKLDQKLVAPACLPLTGPLTGRAGLNRRFVSTPLCPCQSSIGKGAKKIGITPSGVRARHTVVREAPALLKNINFYKDELNIDFSESWNQQHIQDFKVVFSKYCLLPCASVALAPTNCTSTAPRGSRAPSCPCPAGARQSSIGKGAHTESVRQGHDKKRHSKREIVRQAEAGDFATKFSNCHHSRFSNKQAYDFRKSKLAIFERESSGFSKKQACHFRTRELVRKFKNKTIRRSLAEKVSLKRDLPHVHRKNKSKFWIIQPWYQLHARIPPKKKSLLPCVRDLAGPCAYPCQSSIGKGVRPFANRRLACPCLPFCQSKIGTGTARATTFLKIRVREGQERVNKGNKQGFALAKPLEVREASKFGYARSKIKTEKVETKEIGVLKIEEYKERVYAENDSIPSKMSCSTAENHIGAVKKYIHARLPSAPARPCAPTCPFTDPLCPVGAQGRAGAHTESVRQVGFAKAKLATLGVRESDILKNFFYRYGTFSIQNRGFRASSQDSEQLGTFSTQFRNLVPIDDDLQSCRLFSFHAPICFTNRRFSPARAPAGPCAPTGQRGSVKGQTMRGSQSLIGKGGHILPSDPDHYELHERARQGQSVRQGFDKAQLTQFGVRQIASNKAKATRYKKSKKIGRRTSIYSRRARLAIERISNCVLEKRNTISNRLMSGYQIAELNNLQLKSKIEYNGKNCKLIETDRNDKRDNNHAVPSFLAHMRKLFIKVPPALPFYESKINHFLASGINTPICRALPVCVSLQSKYLPCTPTCPYSGRGNTYALPYLPLLAPSPVPLRGVLGHGFPLGQATCNPLTGRAGAHTESVRQRARPTCKKISTELLCKQSNLEALPFSMHRARESVKVEISKEGSNTLKKMPYRELSLNCFSEVKPLFEEVNRAMRTSPYRFLFKKPLFSNYNDYLSWEKDTPAAISISPSLEEDIEIKNASRPVGERDLDLQKIQKGDTKGFPFTDPLCRAPAPSVKGQVGAQGPAGAAFVAETAYPSLLPTEDLHRKAIGKTNTDSLLTAVAEQDLHDEKSVYVTDTSNSFLENTESELLQEPQQGAGDEEKKKEITKFEWLLAVREAEQPIEKAKDFQKLAYANNKALFTKRLPIQQAFLRGRACFSIDFHSNAARKFCVAKPKKLGSSLPLCVPLLAPLPIEDWQGHGKGKKVSLKRNLPLKGLGLGSAQAQPGIRKVQDEFVKDRKDSFFGITNLFPKRLIAEDQKQINQQVVQGSHDQRYAAFLFSPVALATDALKKPSIPSLDKSKEDKKVIFVEQLLQSGALNRLRNNRFGEGLNTRIEALQSQSDLTVEETHNDSTRGFDYLYFNKNTFYKNKRFISKQIAPRNKEKSYVTKITPKLWTPLPAFESHSFALQLSRPKAGARQGQEGASRRVCVRESSAVPLCQSSIGVPLLDPARHVRGPVLPIEDWRAPACRAPLPIEDWHGQAGAHTESVRQGHVKGKQVKQVKSSFCLSSRQQPVYTPNRRLRLRLAESSLSSQNNTPQSRIDDLNLSQSHRWWQKRRIASSLLGAPSKRYLVMPEITANDWRKIIEWQLKTYFLEEEKRLQPLVLEKIAAQKADFSTPGGFITKETNSLSPTSTEEKKVSLKLSLPDVHAPARPFAPTCPFTAGAHTESVRQRGPVLPIEDWHEHGKGLEFDTRLKKSFKIKKIAVYLPWSTLKKPLKKPFEWPLTSLSYQSNHKSSAIKLGSETKPCGEENFLQNRKSNLCFVSSISSQFKTSPLTFSSNCRSSYIDLQKKITKKQFEKSNLYKPFLFEKVTKHSHLVVHQLLLAVAIKHFFHSIYKVFGKVIVDRLKNSSLGIAFLPLFLNSYSRSNQVAIFYALKERFKYLGASEDTVSSLSEIVWYLRNSCRGRMVPRGVVLVEKLASESTEYLKAIGGEAQVPVIVQSLRALTLTKNHPQRRLETILTFAQKKSPCILFLDDLDAIGKSRTLLFSDRKASRQSSCPYPGRGNTCALSNPNPSPFRGKFRFSETYLPLCQSKIGTGKKGHGKGTVTCNRTGHGVLGQRGFAKAKLTSLEFRVKAQGVPLRGKAKAIPLLTKFIRNYESYRFTSSQKNSIESLSIPKQKKLVAQTERSVTNTILPETENVVEQRRVDLMLRLLTVMDGITHLNGVLIITTSQNPSLLDPALLRPGRFEKLIHLKLPNKKRRIELLKTQSSKIGYTNSMPWEYFATRTYAMSGAEIASAINHSAFRAILASTVHTTKTLQYGINRVNDDGNKALPFGD